MERAYVDDVADVVQECDIDVQTRGNQASGLEQVVVVLLPCRRSPLALERRRRRCELAILVDGDEVVGNVVVDAVEHDQQHTDSRRHAQDALVGEAVGLELAVLECPDRVLHGLVAAVQRGQIEVRRRLGLVVVAVVRPEEVCRCCQETDSFRELNLDLPWMMMLAQYQRTLETLLGCFLYSVRFMTES